MRLSKLAIAARRRAMGSQNLRASRASSAALSAFEHRLERTARTWLSFIGAPEWDRLPQGYRVPRAIELVYQRATSATQRRDARSPEVAPRSRSTTGRRPAPERALV